MNLETRADFARRLGWNRSSVTRAVQDGRVVLSGDLVDIDASLARAVIDVKEYPNSQRATSTTPF